MGCSIVSHQSRGPTYKALDAKRKIISSRLNYRYLEIAEKTPQ
jgi:hypothetical protein